MSIVAERIKHLREERNMTQQELADHLGVSLSGYRKMEYGQREPNLDIIRELATFYNVTSDYLLGIADWKNHLAKDMFDVIMASHKVTTTGMELEMYKNMQENEHLITMATRNHEDAKAVYVRKLFDYMVEFFMQPNPNPEEDMALKGKFPIKFSYQPDLFDNVSINASCADGTKLGRVAYYTGVIPERAVEKAERFIDRHEKLFRIKH